MEAENMNIISSDEKTPTIDLKNKTNDSLTDGVESLIYFVRGQQVMIDSDLAQLYGVETKRLKEQVRRNINRFPDDFMFELTKEECLRSQIATLKAGRGQHLKYMPFAFTENGVAMLSSVLKSETAIEVNIRIMRAFTSMRSILMNNSHVFSRIETLEHNYLLINQHLSENDKKIDKALTLLDKGSKLPIQGILFDGQIFDAYVFVCDLIESAKKRIVLIDNYADYSSLRQLDKRSSGVSALVYTSVKNESIKDDLKRHDAQYPSIEVKYYQNVHDRFLIIDDSVYLVGGSFKDLGKKLVGFAKMDSVTPNELIKGIKTKK